MSHNFCTTNIIALSNQKGGVGKTTTAINLGTAMAAIQKKVLIVDLDPQRNATTGLGFENTNIEPNIFDWFIAPKDISKNIIKKTKIPNLDVIPSSTDLTAIEKIMATKQSPEKTLVPLIANLRGIYDYILIDCPPSLGYLTLNAFCAADAVIVPLQCEFYALEGLSHLLKTIRHVRSSANPTLKIQGILLTMYDQRNNLSEMVAQNVRSHLGKRVYQTVIPRNVRVSEAPSHGKPVLLYDRNCAGSIAYSNLAKEMLEAQRNSTYA